MQIYEEYHDEPHFHLGNDRNNQPRSQNKIFNRIIRDLQDELPEELQLRKNSSTSYNVVDHRNRSFAHMNVYKQYGQWRVKIQTYPRGNDFFEDVLKPVIHAIPEDLYQ